MLVFLVFPFSGYANPDTSRLDKIVAIVNGDVITQSEVTKRMVMISHLAGSGSTTSKESTLRKKALDSIIDSLLQMQLARRYGMQISEAEIDNVISNIAKSNHLTVEQLKQSLQEHEGLNFKEYREQIREQVLVSRVQQHSLGKDISVSEQEVEKVLRNPPKINKGIVAHYRVADILIEIPDNASSDQAKVATDIATKIVTKLRQGADIDKLVQEYDVAKQHVSNQDLGWRTVDELPTLFAKEITKMQIGQIIGPLKAPNGLHLIKLLEMQGGQPQTTKFTKLQAQEYVFHQKLEEKLKPWLKELRDAAYIKTID